jgi:AAA domain (dynein-related subfamily).
MKQKIQTLLNQLNHGLVEREDTLKTALLTVLAGENLVLIGPPGTGKSLIARRIAESLAHSSDSNGYFEYLLTKFSTPEEIFGPLSIAELKADRFKRNTAGYLPTVNMAFLDEIFKASSSILNALLTILNERIYHNGAEPQRVPMQALIAASNELPTDQEELSALYDRFLVRSFVDYVSQDNLSRLFENPGAMPELSKLTAADLDSIQRTAESVTTPPDIVEAMQRIWQLHKETFKEDRRENLSDRRLKKVIKLLCVSAATNGRSQVDFSDVFLLKDCLWNHQENAIKVRDLILKTLRTFSRPVPKIEVMALSAIESKKQTYEVAEDGVTGKAPSAPAQASTKLNAVVSGFKGSGTAQDPLLIQTVDELMDLSRTEVGLKGYYFRQTADIDCSALSSWTKTPFEGHYDGCGHTIKYKSWLELFSSIQSQSSITNLKLEAL